MSLSKDDYDEKVQQAAEFTIDELNYEFGEDDDIPTYEMWEACSATANNDEWFVRTYFDTELYAAIVAHRRVDSPEDMGLDWESHVMSDLDDTMRMFARDCFEADVSELVSEKIGDRTYVQ